jgi:hypothetical protein
MATLSENKSFTTLSQILPTPVIDPRASIEIELLRNQPLKNEEIIELLTFICQAEYIEPYTEHINVLRNRYDMTLEMRPLEIEVLSLREKFPLRSLRNFYLAIDDVGYHGLVMKVITLYQWDRAAAVYLLNLETVFVVQPDEQFVRGILRRIEDSDMEGPGINAAEHFFLEKLRHISEYAPIPKYIKDFDIVIEQLPRLQVSTTEYITPDLVAKYIQERLDSMGQYLEIPEDESVQDVLSEMVSNLDASQYDEIVQKMAIDPEEVKRIRDNKDVFRVYGPVNPYPDTDFTELVTEEEPDINLLFGGARMFADLSQEIDTETSTPLDEWFTGYCMQCSLRIRSYHHAVREPGILGGWSGCFCSWDCVRGSIRDGKDNFSFEGDTEDPAKLNMFTIQLALTVQIENDMNEIFIADRDDEVVDESCLEYGENDIIRQEQINFDFVESLKTNSLNVVSSSRNI